MCLFTRALKQHSDFSAISHEAERIKFYEQLLESEPLFDFFPGGAAFIVCAAGHVTLESGKRGEPPRL